MKPLLVFKPLFGLVMLLMIAQLACGVGSAAPTAVAPTSSSGGDQSSPQETQAAAPTSSGEHGTPAEAAEMLKAAVEHYQQAGREQALKDFNDKKPPFGNRDLSVVCLGVDHKVTAMGAFPLLVGTSADSLKDPNGRPIGELVWEAATLEPQGSVPFHWNNPLTGQEESKVLYYQKLDQDVCGVAANQQ